MGNDAGGHTAREELPDGASPGFAVVERPVVHVHADERIRLRPIQAARVLHGMVERGLSVLESIRDAFVQVTGDRSHEWIAEVAANDVPSERQRQPRLSEPPFTQVCYQMKAVVRIRELAFVDE